MQKEMRQDIESQLYRHTTTWQPVIDTVLRASTEQQRRLYKLRYIERLTEREICSSMHIERTTYYRLISDFINDIAVAAAYYQLINPEEY